jgi:hypothetical protein
VAVDRCGNTAIKVWNIYVIGSNDDLGATKTAQFDNTLTPKVNLSELNKADFSTKNVSPSAIVAYPNPSHGVVQLNLNKQIVKEIQVLDVTGKVVYFENQTRNDNPTIDLSQQQFGVYTLRLKMQDGKWNTQKIVLIE